MKWPLLSVLAVLAGIALALILPWAGASAAAAGAGTSSSTPAPAKAASGAEVTPLLTRDLTGIRGMEGELVRVRYAPDAADPIHRHDAHVFVYVLEGSVVMQVEGAEAVTLHPGQTFYEGPNDVHLVGRNASKTKPALFLVFFVKDKDRPLVEPVP